MRPLSLIVPASLSVVVGLALVAGQSPAGVFTPPRRRRVEPRIKRAVRRATCRIFAAATKRRLWQARIS